MASLVPHSMHNQFFRNQLLDKPEVVSEFMSNLGINSICPTVDGKAVCGSKFGNKLVVYGPNGDTLHFIGSRMLETISDITMSPFDNCVWLCVNEDCSIVKVEAPNNEVNVQFHTEQNPWCLCVTSERKVVVGFVNSLISYTLEGKKSREISKDVSGKKIVSHPQRITECPLTQNLAVLDRGWNLLAKDKPFIVVLNRSLHLQFRYNGEVVEPGAKAAPAPWFRPRDVRYNMDGQLLIADKDKNSIHVVSGSGQHIRTLMTDEWKPVSLGIQADNILWVVFKNSSKCKIKLIKYTEPV